MAEHMRGQLPLVAAYVTHGRRHATSSSLIRSPCLHRLRKVWPTCTPTACCIVIWRRGTSSSFPYQQPVWWSSWPTSAVRHDGCQADSCVHSQAAQCPRHCRWMTCTTEPAPWTTFPFGQCCDVDEKEPSFKGCLPVLGLSLLGMAAAFSQHAAQGGCRWRPFDNGSLALLAMFGARCSGFLSAPRGTDCMHACRSYGIVLFELASQGQTPYKDKDLAGIVKQLVAGV